MSVPPVPVPSPPRGPQAAPAPAPGTADDAVDRALAELADLDAAPLADHVDRLTRAHAVLHEALHADPSAP